jgi:hypothetical protein
MLFLLLFASRPSQPTPDDANIPELINLYNQVRNSVEVIREWLSELMASDFFVPLKHIRNALVDWRDAYLRDHEQAYHAHRSRLKQIREDWSKEQTRKREM